MIIDKIREEHSDSLLILMAGWSVPPTFMKSVSLPEGIDCWLIYDYRNLNFEESFDSYKHIYLAAWSLGVWVATYLWAGKDLFECTTALNGTPFPVDDERGIPVAIFEGTLKNIHEDGMRRFNRRMCGNRENFQKYSEYPARPLQEIREELEFLYQTIVSSRGSISDETIFKFWNRAIISSEDKIFPTANLRNCWQHHCLIKEIKAPHLPFYQYEITDELWKQPQQNL